MVDWIHTVVGPFSKEAAVVPFIVGSWFFLQFYANLYAPYKRARISVSDNN